jgi:magnesium chelatase family protein
LDGDFCGGILVMGELELTGKIRAVRGVHAAISSAAEQGISKCIVPAQNEREVQSCGVCVCAVDTLNEAYEACFNAGKFSAPLNIDTAPRETVEFLPISSDMEFSALKNQGALARALQIAAAGRHHVLAFGPPGSGKTLALSRFHALLPLLTQEEARPVSRIYSLAANGARTGDSFSRAAPFRSPHQSSSLEGITGGGRQCSPGEISLAHNGVLFLDEILEFKQHVLQSLRVPLETGSVTVTRAGRSSIYPARFLLLAAANPCPCGNFGARGKICLCGSRSIEQYWKKLSGPLLDRIDIRVPVFPHGQFSDERYAPKEYSTESLRNGIALAASVQRERQKAYNAALSPEEADKVCVLSDDAYNALEEAALMYGFSSRSVSLCRKIARTIADMEQSETIQKVHIEEAVFFRKNEGGVSLGMMDL